MDSADGSAAIAERPGTALPFRFTIKGSIDKPAFALRL
jgi:hypothetical protein